MEAIKNLRNRQAVTLFDRKNKTFTRLQINKKEHFICFQRFESKDRRNWFEQNSYLSLKDCKQILETIKHNNTN